MITFKQFILEEYSYKSVASPTKHIDALYQFKDEDNKDYDVAFAGNNGEYEVAFTTNGAMEKTNNARNSTAVFRTVGNIINYFITSHKPVAITFYSEKLHPSRVRLYKSLAERLAKMHKSSVEYDDKGWKLGFTIRLSK